MRGNTMRVLLGRGEVFARVAAQIHRVIMDLQAATMLPEAGDSDKYLDRADANGHVRCRLGKRPAEDCAGAASGVPHVQNNLRVETQVAVSSSTGSTSTSMAGALPPPLAARPPKPLATVHLSHRNSDLMGQQWVAPYIRDASFGFTFRKALSISSKGDKFLR